MRRLDGQPKRRPTANSTTKACPRCKIVLPRSDFKIRGSGYSASYCRPCENALSYKRFSIMRQDPKWREHMAWLNRKTVLRIKYGTTVEEYDRLFAIQGGVCKICKQPPTRKYLDVDHCHNSKQIRGLLCSNCNRVLGLMREDAALLQTAAAYITENAGFHIQTKRAS